MLFFLLVIACSQGSLFLAFGHRSRFPLEHSTQRYVIATAALVVIWLVMLGAAVVALYAELDANLFMPPLERLAHALTLLLLGWVFLSADFTLWRSRSNLFIFGASLLLTLLFINTARSWLLEYEAGLAFNAGQYASLWTAVTGGIAAALLLLTALNMRHIADAPLKALLFLLFLGGSAWELWQIGQGQVDGNYQGAARLAYAAGLALLPVIIHRLAVALLENSLVEVVLAASQPAAALPAEAAVGAEISPRAGLAQTNPLGDSPRLLAAIGMMLASDNRADVADRIVQATQSALGAELCMLLNPPDEHSASVVAGWDAAAQKSLAGAQLDLTAQPTLLAVAQSGEMNTLLPDHHTDELHDLFGRIGVDGLSSLLAQPVLAQGALIGLLLVGSPYRQTDLTATEQALLADIAAVAGLVLANQAKNRQQPQRVAAVPAVDLDDRLGAKASLLADMTAIRRDLAAGLAGSVERIAKLRLQIDGLEKQLVDEQGRLLAGLAASNIDASAVAGLRGALSERAALLVECEASASALLDAEAALLLLKDRDAHKQSLHEYLHKQYNRQLHARDRLRRQVSAFMLLRRSAPGDALATILQQLNDEQAQLELQRDQQRRRQRRIAQDLAALGISSDAGAPMLAALAHLHAERLAFGKQLDDADARFDSLQAQHQSLLDAGAGDKQALEAQLKQLSVDHEALLESRETLRREQQHILADAEAAELARLALEKDKQLLEATVAEERARQREAQEQIHTLAEERDNLLTIRDRLTAKVTELLDDATDREANAQLQSELTILRASVARLSQQREDLALDLSDARLESAHAPEPPLPVSSAPALLSLLRDLREPIGSARSYIDLLLSESIGILGAAQLQMLRLASAELVMIADLLMELQRAAASDARRSQLWDDIATASLIEGVIADASLRFAEKNLLIELSLDDNLPPLPSQCLGLKHMLTLLVANACEASPPGSRVLVAARKDDSQRNHNAGAIDMLAVRVHDSGGGIASGDLPRLFERTYRERYPAIPGVGDTGVGITVARAVARAHKGDIWVTSEKDKGSTFHLALPLQPVALAEA